MLKIKSVAIAGMHKVAREVYSFDEMNYVVGPNGSGKSTVLEAIQLALLGYIPSTGKQSSAIFKHANGRSIEITLTITDEKKEFSDGVITLQRSWVNTGKSIVSDVKVNPESVDIESMLGKIELPIFNFNEFIGMTANKLKEWFLLNMTGCLKSDGFSWEAKFKDTLSNVKLMPDDDFIIQNLQRAKEADKEGNPITSGNSLNASLKSTLSQLKAESSQLSNTLRSLVHYDDVDNSEYTLDDVNDKLAKYRFMNERYVFASSRAISNKHIEEDLSKFDLSESREADPIILNEQNQLATLMKQQEGVMAKLADAKDVWAEVSDKEREATVKNASASVAAQSPGICPFTNEVCETAESFIAAKIKEAEDAEAVRVEMSKKVAKAKEDYDKLNSELNSIQLKISGCQSRINSRASDYDRYEYLKSKLLPVNEDELNVDHDFIELEITRLEDIRSKLIANESYNNLKDQVSKDIDYIDQLIYITNTWLAETAANSQTMTDLANLPFQNIAKDIDVVLSELFGEKQITTDFNLEAKANSFSFGINRAGQYIPFEILSSGEKCLFSISLMIAILNKSTTPVKVILIDDLLDHLDTNRFSNLFDRLTKLSKKYNIQFVFAGVQPTNNESLNVIELK